MTAARTRPRIANRNARSMAAPPAGWPPAQICLPAEHFGIRSDSITTRARLDNTSSRRTRIVQRGASEAASGRTDTGKTASEQVWRPQRDLNPCYRLERAVSWARLDDGDTGLTPIYDLAATNFATVFAAVASRPSEARRASSG